MRSGKDDVVNLPLARGQRGIHQRRVLAIDRACGTVGIRGVVEAIQHLNFVFAVQEHAAVAAALAVAMRWSRRGPFDMKLEVAEVIFGVNVAGLGNGNHFAVFDLPFARLGLIAGMPLVEILSIEEHDGVGGRLAWNFGRAEGAGRDDAGLRACAVVDMPLAAGFLRKHRGVLVAQVLCGLGFVLGGLFRTNHNCGKHGQAKQ